ncbi:MAG: PhoH family protein [Rhodospirillales bacterium]|nr:PhoH family protein [Rhodospirillales bacterium]
MFGEHNSHLSYLEEKLGISIADRGNKLTLSGDDKAVRTAEDVLHTLWDKIEKKHEIGTAEIDAALRFLHNDAQMTHDIEDKPAKKAHALAIQTKRKMVAPRSPNQERYIQAIQNHEMVFGLGPAGTGKTYLAVAVGVSMFLEGKVERLIFARPAVEAGERLGFLPGDMKEKVDPYLRPIYDALHDMLPYDFMVKKIEGGDIEIAPLAFMRGRTLSNAFVILDEAQNTTTTQMKMILTRLGESSRMVINGDLSQTDLPVGVKSGLRDATEILEGIEDIKFIHFQKDDVIRHKLVSKIVHAYDQKK